jgi:diguanylate cyclase (GGDEF)-like protein
VNDRFGHTIGDQVLQMATRILWEALRTDDVIFRYGGEEFCVLLAGVAEPPTALGIAERLRAALDCSLVVNELVRVPISASLGVAIHPLHGALKARELLDLADDAAYQAKISGKNRVVLAPLPAPPA